MTIPWEVREAAIELVLEGQRSRVVGDLLGVSESVVRYWSRLSGMNIPRGPGAPLRTPPELVNGPHPARTYRRLTHEDRVLIQLGVRSGLTQTAIAEELGVHRATVSREIRNHALAHRGELRYIASVAHHHAMVGRQRPRAGKLEQPRLRAAVVSRLNEKFSPQQIQADLIKQFPGDKEMRVSHETIYQALYVQGAGALRHELTVEKALRSGKKGRAPKSELPGRGKKSWVDGARLADRPARAEDRSVPGHWEGDLVVGPEASGIVTLVERRSRTTLLGKLPAARDSATVVDVLQHMITQMPGAVFNTITWDQGSEMAFHRHITVATGCKVFFCDPHSPWQRPTNENTNGLIRDFYPKGTNFNRVTEEDLARTAYLLNKRPRKVLDWDTPAERLAKIIDQDVALAP